MKMLTQNPGFQSLTFERSVPLTGIIGFRGIAVIGANLVKRIEIVGEPFQGRNLPVMERGQTRLSSEMSQRNLVCPRFSI